MPLAPDQIKALRDRLGYTQQQLADAMGVHRVTVARWETGVRRTPEPAARLIELLASAHTDD